MGVVVAEVGEHRDRPGLLHGPEVLAHLPEERPLLADRFHLGQEVARDEHEARLLGLDGGHQVAPLLDALVEVAGQDELQVHFCRPVDGRMVRLPGRRFKSARSLFSR